LNTLGRAIGYAAKPIRRFLLVPAFLPLADQQYIVNRVAGESPGPEPATNAGLNISGVTIDQAENVYLSQYSRVFKVDTPGNLAVVAGKWMTFNGQTSGGDGGPATQASISSASSIAVDASGNIYRRRQTVCLPRSILV